MFACVCCVSCAHVFVAVFIYLLVSMFVCFLMLLLACSFVLAFLAAHWLKLW